jgi:WD40 repeat protein
MDPGTLASGSQDGIMKFFDLRSFEMVAQFVSNTGSVRDLQFNPHSFYQVSKLS